MRLVDVNFKAAARPARWMWIAVGALWLVAGGLGTYAWHEHRHLELLRAQVVALRASATRVVDPASPVPPPYAESARQMLAQRESAWPAALSALEQVQVKGVQVVGFDVSTTEKRIRVELRCDDIGQLLDYLHALNLGEAQPRWSFERASQSSAKGQFTAFIVGTISS